jgi:hypothetical protein
LAHITLAYRFVGPVVAAANAISGYSASTPRSLLHRRHGRAVPLRAHGPRTRNQAVVDWLDQTL